MNCRMDNPGLSSSKKRIDRPHGSDHDRFIRYSLCSTLGAVMTNPSASPPGPATDVVVSRAADTSPATWAMGMLFERLAGAEETLGLLSASVVTQPPGQATPLHVHTREAEAWFLLEGAITYRAGGQLIRMTAGDFIYLPREVPHAFRTTGAVRPGSWPSPCRAACSTSMTRSASRPLNGACPTRECRTRISPGGWSWPRGTVSASSGRRSPRPRRKPARRACRRALPPVRLVSGGPVRGAGGAVRPDGTGGPA